MFTLDRDDCIGGRLAQVGSESVPVLRSTVLFIALILAFGQPALLCANGCLAVVPVTSACEHGDATRSAVQAGQRSCDTMAPAPGFLTEAVRRGDTQLETQHAPLVSSYRWAPSTFGVDVERASFLDARPLVTALRI